MGDRVDVGSHRHSCIRLPAASQAAPTRRLRRPRAAGVACGRGSAARGAPASLLLSSWRSSKCEETTPSTPKRACANPHPWPARRATQVRGESLCDARKLVPYPGFGAEAPSSGHCLPSAPNGALRRKCNRTRGTFMSENTEFTIGSEVVCSDGACGELMRVVVNPVARVLTHLVVERRFQQGTGRLVPIDLVETAAHEVRLRCSMSEFEALEEAEEKHLVQGAPV